MAVTSSVAILAREDVVKRPDEELEACLPPSFGSTSADNLPKTTFSPPYILLSLLPGKYMDSKYALQKTGLHKADMEIGW